MSGTDIRVIDLPDLGTVTDASSIVADSTGGTGRFSALAVKAYCAVAGMPEAPSNNTPYGRMNAAWTPVLPEAPTGGVTYGRRSSAWTPVVPEAPLDGAAYGRINGTWTQVLPTTGGAVSGTLSVSGNMSTGAGVFANDYYLSSGIGYAWHFYVQSGPGNHIQQHSAGWYDSWEPAGGARRWVGAAGNQMTLDPSGDLIALGYMNATQFWSNAGGAAVGQFGFAAGGSGRVFQFRPNFYLDFSMVAGGTDATLQYVVSNGPLWVMRPSDDFCFNPQSNVGGNGAYLNVSDRRAKSNIVPTSKGLAEVLQLQPVSFDRVNASTGAQQEIGFVAQDVQPIVPEAVWQAGIPLRDGSGGLDSADPTLGLTSETITAINVNAIKELNALIAALTDRIAALEAAP